MIDVIQDIGNALWENALLWIVLGCGLWFTIRLGGAQFRMFGSMFRLLADSSMAPKEGKHISSFQAFAVSIATRIGTGNLAGVALAIATGGPGAVFWMWVMALLGMATAFVESTLAQLFKQKHSDSYIGGPAYYIKKGLKSKWMAVAFSLLIILNFGLSNNSVQSNTICDAMDKAFGVDPMWMGVFLSVISLVIVFGGIQRIAHVSSVIVPVMALGYLILALYIIASNISLVSDVFQLIVEDAFGFRQVAGGGIGMAVMVGVKRGLFSNEAGEGSAPHAAATAAVSHPVKQGLIQSLGVFTDTIIVCSCTAFIILISGLYTQKTDEGILLTQEALNAEIGSTGTIFVAIAIFLFAYSSIIGNYYYGEANIRFLTQKRWVMTAYRICSAAVAVLSGALLSLEYVWSINDICMGLLTACNLMAILLLGKYAFRLLDDYRRQKKAGIKNPTFHKSKFPEIEDDIECWE